MASGHLPARAEMDLQTFLLQGIYCILLWIVLEDGVPGLNVRDSNPSVVCCVHHSFSLAEWRLWSQIIIDTRW